MERKLRARKTVFIAVFRSFLIYKNEAESGME